MIIPIKNKKHGIQNMEIDDEDYNKIKNLNLTLNDSSNKYTFYGKCVIWKNGKYIKTINIHRLIMGLDDFKIDKRIIHHKDGNGLNNKKSNLIICSLMYNNQSINKPHQNNGIIYFEKNTEKTKRRKQWRFIMVVNKKKHSKRFLTQQEAEEYKKEFVKSLSFNP
jgi:hypothetical protein